MILRCPFSHLASGSADFPQDDYLCASQPRPPPNVKAGTHIGNGLPVVASFVNPTIQMFAGSDEGAENWAASLIESCKLHSINPEAYLTDVLTKLVNNWPNSRLAELTPWGWSTAH